MRDSGDFKVKVASPLSVVKKGVAFTTGSVSDRVNLLASVCMLDDQSFSGALCC